MRNIWKDASGRAYKIIKTKDLKFSYPAAAALRAHVFKRDYFTCSCCSAKPDIVPVAYDGRYTVYVSGWPLFLYHITPIADGGAHHPDNLKLLCEGCSATIDATFKKDRYINRLKRSRGRLKKP